MEYLKIFFHLFEQDLFAFIGATSWFDLLECVVTYGFIFLVLTITLIMPLALFIMMFFLILVIVFMKSSNLTFFIEFMIILEIMYALEINVVVSLIKFKK